MVAPVLLVVGLAIAPAFGPASGVPNSSEEPQLQLDRNFALPSVDYRAPDGTWKHGNGIIIGRDISPSTTVGIGFFRMKAKSQEGMSAPPQRASHKVSLGFSLRF